MFADDARTFVCRVYVRFGSCSGAACGATLDRLWGKSPMTRSWRTATQADIEAALERDHERRLREYEHEQDQRQIEDEAREAWLGRIQPTLEDLEVLADCLMPEDEAA